MNWVGVAVAEGLVTFCWAMLVLIGWLGLETLTFGGVMYPVELGAGTGATGTTGAVGATVTVL